MIRIILVLLSFFAFISCGVKGDPLPPETAPKLGRGYPTYKKAGKTIQVEYGDFDDEPEENEEEEEQEQ